MGSPIFYTLLIAISCLAAASAECCITVEDVTFTLDRGTCQSVGGYGGNYVGTCEVRICADGVPQVGSYCGRGPCNIFGCNCDYGCLAGEWTKSFVERNKEYGVRVVQSHKFP